MDFTNKRIAVHHVIEIVLLLTMFLFIDKGMMTPVRLDATSSPYDITSDYSSGTLPKAAPSCDTGLMASVTAKTIDIPHVEGTDEYVNCEWTIKSPHPSLTIGIAIVQPTLIPDYRNNFFMYVYDGPSSRDKLLGYWRGKQSLADFLKPMTSTSDVIFIVYTAIRGAEILEFKIAYYICGGTIQSDMQIGSPVFSPNATIYDVPERLQCVWHLQKPKNAIYGYMHMHKINFPGCDVLNVKTISGKLAALEKNVNVTSSVIDPNDTFTIARNALREQGFWDTYDVTTTSSPQLNTTVRSQNYQTMNLTAIERTHELNICNSTVQAIAFSGPSAILTYTMLYSEYKYGFSAAYVTVRMPITPRTVKTPWYHNYAPVAIYLPLGIVIGAIIIILQGRRRGPPKPTVKRDDAPHSQTSSDANCICIAKLAPKSIMKTRRGYGTGGIQENGVTSVPSRHQNTNGDSLGLMNDSGANEVDASHRQKTTVEERHDLLRDNRDSVCLEAPENLPRDKISTETSSTNGKKVTFRTITIEKCN